MSVKLLASVTAVLVVAGCYDDSQCRPVLVTRDSLAAESSVLNEAEWVERRRDTHGASSFENTVLTDGLPARRLYTLLDTAQCSDKALRVIGPPGSTVKQTRRAAFAPQFIRCEPPYCDYSEIQVVDVSVDWTAKQGPSSIEMLWARLPLHVAANATARAPLAVIPTYCAFVARLGPEVFLCDTVVFDSTGSELARVDGLTTIDAMGATWVTASGDAGVLTAYRWNGGVVPLGQYAPGQTSPRPVLLQSGLLFPIDGGLSLLDLSDGGISVIHDGGTPLALARSSSGPIWLDGTGTQACSLRGEGVSCIAVDGTPTGTDRGLWLESYSKDTLSVVAVGADGRPELSAVGPRIRHSRFAPLGYFKPYRVPLHPGFLATRAMCAFREIQSDSIDLTVLPEGTLGPEQTPHGLDIWALKGAAGDGYEGLRWCTDDRMSKTYVYDGE